MAQIHDMFASIYSQNGDIFSISDHCLKNLEEILLKLSTEDRTLRTYRRAIGFGQNINRDLLPLLLNLKDDLGIASKIIDTGIRILVDLTIPIEYLLPADAITRSDVGRHTIFELNKLVISGKEAFTDGRHTKIITDHIKFLIESDLELDIVYCESINNCLLLLRNILHISENRSIQNNVSTSMQNQIIWNLFMQNIDKIIIYLISRPQKIIVYIILLVLAGMYLFLRNQYKYWQQLGIPYDPPFLIFGSFFKVALQKEHLFYRIRSIYNEFKNKTPYLGIYIFHQPNLIVISPDLIKTILVKDFDKFLNRSNAANEKVDPISFHSLFSARDGIWKNIRAKISPVFTSGKMKTMYPLMTECVTDVINHLSAHSGEVIEVKMLTKKYAIDIITSCAFGMNSNCVKTPENNSVLKMALQLIDVKSFVRNFSLMCFFFVPKFVDWFKLTFADPEATEYFKEMYTFGLKERQKNKVVRHDLIDLLDKLRKNENTTDTYIFDDVKMASQAISFFSAGNETSSLMISYTLYELAYDQNIQNRLRKEVKEVSEKYNGITYEAIQDMKYLDMIFSETLRKYPLTSFLNRQAASDYTFSETNVTIEKGTPLIIPVSGLHYDGDYFPEPEKFNPERFSDENKSKIVPFTYLPFGDGPRNCIGQRFALLVTKIAISSIIKDFQIDSSEQTSYPVKFNAGSIFLQNKGGLFLKTTKISKF